MKNITEMQVRVGRWLSARGDRLSLVATNDIGAIGFITRAPILDLTGLATPEVIPYLRLPAPPGRRSRGWNGANEAALLEYLRERRPDYVAIFPSWYPSPFFRAALGEMGVSQDKLFADRNHLADILKYHIVDMSEREQQVMAMSGQEFTTENGAKLAVSVAGNTAKVGNAMIVKPDVVASNGVVHVIDKLLVPPAK